MKALRIIGGILLLILLLGGLGGSAWLWTERSAILSQDSTVTAQFDNLKEQITKAAEVQDKNRDLQNQVDDLQRQLGEAQRGPTPDIPAPPATPGLPVIPPGPGTTPTPEQPTPTRGGATPGGPGGIEPPAEVLSRMAEIEKQVIAIRGLPEQRPVQRRFLSREDLRTYLIQEMEEEDTPEDYRHSAQELWLLGLGEKDLDLQTLLLELQTEQIAGFYDPETDSFYLIGEDAKFSGNDQIIYAHEFDHNLQDQLIDLNQILRSTEFDGDRGMAFRSVVEGDATHLMGEWTQKELLPALEPAELLELSQELGQTSSEKLDSAPRIIRESLTFPYESGQAFVQRLYDQGGWDLVNQALKDPPTSSEQILHPEKYLSTPREEPSLPERFDLSGALGAGWTVATTNTLGEFDLRVLLDETRAAGDPESAAAGISGARYALYEQASDQTPLLQMTLRWDTPQDGQEFLEAFRSTIHPEGDIFTRGDILIGIKGPAQEHTLLFSATEASLRAALAAQP